MRTIQKVESAEISVPLDKEMNKCWIEKGKRSMKNSGDIRAVGKSWYDLAQDDLTESLSKSQIGNLFWKTELTEYLVGFES